MTYFQRELPLAPPPISEESQARIREAAAALASYHIGPAPEDALSDESKIVHYCMAKQGVMEIRRSLIGWGISPAKQVAGLPEMRCGFQMSLPKIPFTCLAQTVNFFREVIRRNNNRSLEAIVQFFWDPATEGYILYIPPQRVGGGSVNHQGNGDPDNRLIHVADIHSHGSSMSAFFSGTDDGDESRAERLYGVIGNVLDPIPTMKFRARVGSAFVDLTMGDMIDLPTESIQVAVPIQAIINRTAGGDRIDPFVGHPPVEEWFKEVTVETHITYKGKWDRSGYSHDDAYHAHEGVPGRTFRPAWARNASSGGSDHQADRAGHQLPPTVGHVMMVSSSGRRYIATKDGMFGIQPKRVK